MSEDYNPITAGRVSFTTGRHKLLHIEHNYGSILVETHLLQKTDRDV